MGISERHSEAAKKNLLKAEEAKAKQRVQKSCERCGKILTLPISVAARKRFCSWKCRQEFMRGPNGPNSGKGQKMTGTQNPRWHGGHATERKARYHEIEVAQWRRRVFYRDKYTCQRCHVTPKTSHQLRAHHIATWASSPELRFEIANGITLCIKCHLWVHSAENASRQFLK